MSYRIEPGESFYLIEPHGRIIGKSDWRILQYILNLRDNNAPRELCGCGDCQPEESIEFYNSVGFKIAEATRTELNQALQESRIHVPRNRAAREERSPRTNSVRQTIYPTTSKVGRRQFPFSLP